MARKKVKLAWIANDAARRATFKKRRKGLLKKVSELTTLCGVKACVIVYGAGEQQPEVWPSAPEAMRLVSRFKSLPEMEQCKKMMNQEGFIRHNIGKMQEQLRKLEVEFRELESVQFMYECLTGNHTMGLRSIVNVEDANNLIWVLDMKLKSIQEKMSSMSVNDGGSGGGGGGTVASAASASQIANFTAVVEGQLHNPFPLLRPPTSAPVFSAGSSSSAHPPQNLLNLAKNRLELAAAEAALMQRQNYYSSFGAANRSSTHGTLSSIIQNNNQGIMNMMQLGNVPNSNQSTMHMMHGIIPHNNQGAMNMMQGGMSGAGGHKQEEMLPPGFEEQQAMNLSSWFNGNSCSSDPNYRSNYKP